MASGESKPCHADVGDKMIDVILVRYCFTDDDVRLFDKTVDYLSTCPVTVHIRDNTHDNIGLNKARIELLEKCAAPVIVMMDFDFERIDIDFPALAVRLDANGVGMTLPYSVTKVPRPPYTEGVLSKDEWQEIRTIPCNCMCMKRSTYAMLGGLYSAYHTAYSDVDLCRRIWKHGMRIEQHNKSCVVHVGKSSDRPEKRGIWDADRKILESRRYHFKRGLCL